MRYMEGDPHIADKPKAILIVAVVGAAIGLQQCFLYID